MSPYDTVGSVWSVRLLPRRPRWLQQFGTYQPLSSAKYPLLRTQVCVIFEFGDSPIQWGFRLQCDWVRVKTCIFRAGKHRGADPKPQGEVTGENSSDLWRGGECWGLHGGRRWEHWVCGEKQGKRWSEGGKCKTGEKKTRWDNKIEQGGGNGQDKKRFQSWKKTRQTKKA